MSNTIKFFGVVIAFALLATGCFKEPTMSHEEIEQRSLRAWIEKYHPELVENYQEDGGYYVEIHDPGRTDSLPISGKDVWVWYDFTGRDLDGNIHETRNWEQATLVGTYTNYTHYVPAYRFSGKESTTMMEGTYLATFNKLKIGQDSISVRYGTEMTLYLPSSVVATTESSTGGYEGQYELSESKPMIVRMKVWGHVGNPVAYEGDCVDTFAEANGGLCSEHKAVVEDSEAEKSMRRRYATRGDESTEEEEEEVDTRPLEFYDGRWHQPVDTMAQLYVKYLYNPKEEFTFNVLGSDTLKYEGEDLYTAGNIYNNSSNLNTRINTALVERFGRGITADEVLATDSLKTKTTAKVWYIGRFLDGFIFDTNIDEVKEIIYGEVTTAGEALTFYTKNMDENKYIPAWNYSIPTLRQGQWAAILTVSTYGYGISGKVGSYTSTTTGNSDQAYYDYLNYMNYMNYMNSYYGYGYGNMYNQGYYGYNPYYYGYGYSSSGQNTSETITTTSTEIPAFSPLLFQIFVE
ncbi:MAG: hypothetical protein J6R01_08025 [Alistipes sp.]|nr:hypothetical protein [Alistipes sp.]